MLIDQTLDKLNAMKLGAMADAVQQQRRADDVAGLSFEERLVDIEWTAREQRKLTRRHLGLSPHRPPRPFIRSTTHAPDQPVLRSQPPH